MNKEKTFLKNTSIIVIGKICTQCVSFFLLPLYTAVLSTSDYGVVDLLNTYITLLLPIASLQMEQGFFRFLVDTREDEERKNSIFATAFWGLSASTLLFSIILAAVVVWLKIPYGGFLIINIMISCYSSNMLGAARGLGLYGIYSIGSFLIGVTTIVFNVVFIVFFKMNAMGMLLAYFCANFIGAIFCFFKLRSIAMLTKEKFKIEVYREILKYTLPLIPNTISWWVINASDRTIVSMVLGIAANGIYSVANKFSGVYITVYSLFNMTLTENVILYSKSDSGKEFLTRIMDGYIRFFSCICLGIIACMPFVFPYMVNTQFSDSYRQIPILMIATMFNVYVGLCTTLYVAQKKSGQIARYAVMSAIVNVAINLSTIKFIGLYAASISTCVSYALTATMMYIDLKKTDNMIDIDLKYLLLFFLVLIATIGTYYKENTMLHILTLIAVFVFSLLSIKKYWNQVVIEIKKKS